MTNVVQHVQEILNDKQAIDCAVYIGEATVCDFMIVASCTSLPHLRAVANAICSDFRIKGQKPVGADGLVNDSPWIAIDLFSVIVHLFLPYDRQKLDIGSLWQKT